jgi:glycosyltransferase involved in cell wall biosynthesis
MEPSVSVIIPTYNRAALLKRAIHSVVGQSWKDWELLVVDDASTDATESVVRSFGDERIQYIRHDTNGGASAARNSGIARARGRFICFLDSDDEYLPTKLEEQVALLERCRSMRIGAVECARDLEQDGVIRTVPPSLRGVRAEDLFFLREGLQIASLLIDRRYLDGLHFDVSLPAWEDFDFLISLLRRCDLAFSDRSLIITHRHPGPRLSKSDAMAVGLQRLMDKHRKELQRRPRVRGLWHFRLGLVLLSGGDPGRGRQEILRALRAWPFSPKRWALLAGLLMSRRLPWAYRAYRAASTLKSRVSARLRPDTSSPPGGSEEAH